MGIALMPQGISLMINPRGDAMREGRRSVGTRGWWWGVTRQSQHKELAYKLAHHLANTGNQIEECSAFGMVPARQDLLGELGLMFGGGWTANLFHISSQQLVENRLTVPPMVEEYLDISHNYSEAYQAICLPGISQKTRFEDIQTALEERYIPRQKQVLGPKYPSRQLSIR
jgi:ABC-type glycerol-3-phosphate transport system substrate-binding protein